jgi:hypothetical protein
MKVLKADHAHQRLLPVVQDLKMLFADENFERLLYQAAGQSGRKKLY